MRRRVRRYRLRHKIHAIKTRPNNPQRFLKQKNVSVAISQTINFFVIRKATFRTQKRFHNKQYTPKLKDQPFESERTHFDTGFNNGSIAMHPSDLYFSSSTPNLINQPQNQSQKQPQQTIQNLSIKNTPKTKHNKQTRQVITTKCNVFEY